MQQKMKQKRPFHVMIIPPSAVPPNAPIAGVLR